MSTKLTLNQINKALEKKDISPEFEKSLKNKKEILTKNKTIKKDDSR